MDIRRPPLGPEHTSTLDTISRLSSLVCHQDNIAGISSYSWLWHPRNIGNILRFERQYGPDMTPGLYGFEAHW